MKVFLNILSQIFCMNECFQSISDLFYFLLLLADKKNCEDFLQNDKLFSMFR